MSFLHRLTHFYGNEYTGIWTLFYSLIFFPGLDESDGGNDIFESEHDEDLLFWSFCPALWKKFA